MGRNLFEEQPAKGRNLFAEQQPAQPEKTIGEDIVGSLETVGTILSGAVAEPIAGIAGIAQAINPFAEAGAGAETVRDVREALSYQPITEAGIGQVQAVGEALQPIGEAFGATEKYLGESVLDITGSPALATIAHTLPTAALEAIGVKGLRGAKKTITPEDIQIAKDFTAKGLQYKSPYKSQGFKLSDADKKYQMDEALIKGDKETLAAMMEADPEFFKALDVLEAKEKGVPSAAATNRQYQETEQALKKIPGSELSKLEANQITELQQISDNLITDFGGVTDKSGLSMRLLSDSQKAISDLESVTEKAYSDISKNIPNTARSEMNSIGDYINQELTDLGGDIAQLSPLERRLLKMSEEGSTYRAIDKIRKEVGATIGKKSEKYKSEDVSALKQIYSKLTDDQEVVAGEFGMSDSWSAAKELVSKRKALEDDSIKMFGKNLSDSFMPKIGLATKKLSKGDYKSFSELINSVPKKNRQEVVISALNDAFTMGSRKEQRLSVAGFADWYNGLNKNQSLKNKFYQYLPRDLSRKLDALGKVTNGIRNAQAAAPVGGQLMASTGVASKAVNGVGRKILSKLPGFTGDLVQLGLDKSKSKGLDAAINLISDRDFISNIRDLSKGQADKAAAAERKLMKSKKMRDFINTLPTREAKALTSLGVTAWLSRPTNERDNSADK